MVIRRVFLKLSILAAIVIGGAAVFIPFGLPGMTTSVLANGSGITSIEILHFDDDGVREPLLYTDGTVIGEGMHVGDLKCIRDNCNGRTYLTDILISSQPTDIEIEYKMKSLVARDIQEERVVVAGTGTITGGGQKERFSFVATFQNNRDGTVYSRYDASRPDASFIIQETTGTFGYE